MPLAFEILAGLEAQFGFTCGDPLGVTVSGERYAHLVFQLVISHSGCRYAEVTADDDFLALKRGLQNALWVLSARPQCRHSTH